MIIPFEKLNPETLRNLLEEFVSRDGTDSGYTGGSLDQKVDAVMRQLTRKKAFIVYDDQTETCNIVPEDLLPRPSR